MHPRTLVDDAVAEAIGRHRRSDPVRPLTGGPAGNARLTAWLGTLLLALFLVELATLLDVRSLLSWHIVVGVLLVPPALAKTASTGWRIVRYYTGHPAYRKAGPPPMVLRVLGPLVVLTTLAVLGTGLALVALGPDAGRTALFTVLGFRVTVLTLHQGTFLVWAAATGLHTLGRLLPALRILGGPSATGNAVPGGQVRGVVLFTSVLVAALTAVLVLDASGAWLTTDLHQHREPGTRSRPVTTTIEP
jgi:hypothetical protein